MESNLESFIPSSDPKSNLFNSNLIEKIYDEIIQCIDRPKLHKEVKIYLLKKYCDMLKPYQTYNNFSICIYPDNTNYIIISGIFGLCYDMTTKQEYFIGLNIYDAGENISHDSFDVFNPIYILPKPKEVDKNDLRRSQSFKI
jgi:hypothetical protein